MGMSASMKGALHIHTYILTETDERFSTVSADRTHFNTLTHSNSPSERDVLLRALLFVLPWEDLCSQTHVEKTSIERSTGKHPC